MASAEDPGRKGVAGVRVGRDGGTAGQEVGANRGGHRGMATVRGSASGARGGPPSGYFRNHQVRGADERVMGPNIRMGLAAMAATSFPFPVSRRFPAG